MIHDKIKDVKCDKCEFVCSTNGQLKQHIKQVHERPQTDKRMSLGEFAIHMFLTKQNIEFDREKTFHDLLSSKCRKLRYDFAIHHNDTIMLIEFDGQQHFKKVRWQKDDTEQQVEDHFNYIVDCDQKKNEYAEQNDYKLLRIKYTDIKNIDSILTEFLKDVLM